MNEKLYDVWLSLRLSPSSRKYGELINYFGDAFGVYRACEEELIFAGVGPREAAAVADKGLDRSFEILRFCERHGVGLLCPGDRGYPAILAGIPTPPQLLYVLGTLPDMDKKTGVGIVGTRNMSVYGMEQAYGISYCLASSGAVIVSGMAKGIDGVAAVAAIEAGGSTVAVVGTGINVVFPSEHASLAREIACHGAIVSEYPPDSSGLSWHFPQRNRIISGLSRATVVVEAGERSGAVITADCAFRQKRHVFAVPGNVGNPNSAGTNGLLRRGGIAALDAGDIIALLDSEDEGSLSVSRFAEATLRCACDTEILGKYGVAPGKDTPGRAAQTIRSAIPAAPVKAPVISVKRVCRQERTEEKETCIPPAGRMRDMWSVIPEGQRVSPDYFTGKGYGIGEAMNLLSMLEISGYVKSVPGGMYEKIVSNPSAG